MAINGFFGEYRFLSNFWPCKVTLDGVEYDSVEHAYQAAKTIVADERKLIKDSKSPGEAKRRGKKVRLRSEWHDDAFRVEMMRYLVRQKFMNSPELRSRLLSTREQELIETNTWGDVFWGMCNGHGLNNLGRILMDIREEQGGTKRGGRY